MTIMVAPLYQGGSVAHSWSSIGRSCLELVGGATVAHVIPVSSFLTWGQQREHECFSFYGNFRPMPVL